jgi:Predicted Fe-S-cluster oxidoreductase
MDDPAGGGQRSPQDPGNPAQSRSPGEPDRHAGIPGDLAGTVPIACRIIALRQEQNRLFAFPADLLAQEIRTTGFSCTCCGACCTRAVNRHIFLLDRDVTAVQAIDPGAYRPAPDPEFCDENGTLYDSGYALVMDGSGACRFLKNNRCQIYSDRFLVCRVYPYMIRRETGSQDSHRWCTFARKNDHGEYGGDLPDETCMALAREVLAYENGFLSQQIAFLEAVKEHFTANGLCHDPAKHRESIRGMQAGTPVPVKVFRAGEFEDWPHG